MRVKVVFAEPDNSFFMLGAVLTGEQPYVAAIAGALHVDEAEVGDMAARIRAERLPADLVCDCVVADGEQELLDGLRDADLVVTERVELGARHFAAAPDLRLVQKFGMNPKVIDVTAAAAAGVAVSVTRRLGNRRVAEHALALALALVKHLSVADRAVRAGSPGLPVTAHAYNWTGMTQEGSLLGRSLGIIGLGETGSELAALSQGLSMEVCYTQRTPDAATERRVGARYVGLDELLATADVVSIHLPAAPSTTGLIGARELGLMRPGSVLVNTSRAVVVDEAALVRALRQGAIGGAALDVFWQEPLPPDHPLTALDNVLLTPHVATGAVSQELWAGEFGDLLDNVVRLAGGRAPARLVA